MKNKKIINYLLVFTMLFTYVSPVFEIFDVNAEDEKVESNVSRDKFSFGNLDEEENYLVKMNPNETKDITLETNEDYHIQWCYSGSGDFISAYTSDYKTCKITANNYGKGYIVVDIANSDNTSTYREYIYVDSQLDKYMDMIMDKYPNEIEYNHYWEYMPEVNNVSVYLDNCEGEGNQRICDAIFSYHYEVMENHGNHVSPYTKRKKVTAKNNIEKFNIAVGNSYLDKGEKKLIYLNHYDDSYENVIWVSENTSVATVDQNGVVTGVGKGTTTIKVYDKTTFESSSLKIYVIESAFKNVEEFKESLDNKTIIIDVNNENKIFYYYNESEKYQQIFRNFIIKYFRDKMVPSLSFYDLENVSCTNNVCSATVQYQYLGTDGYYKYEKFNVSNVTLEFTGIRLKENYRTLGDIFDITYESYLGDKEVTILHEEEYLEKQPDGTYKAIKPGITIVKAISEGYSDTYLLRISYPYDVGEQLNNYLLSLKNIELPYLESEFITNNDLKYLENIIKQKVINEYPDSDLRDELTAKVVCINSNNCNISIYDKYNENLISYSYSKILSNISYKNTDIDTVKELKRLDTILNDMYVVDINDVINIENTCNGVSNCVYDALINYTDLNIIKSNANLKIDYEVLNTFEFKGLVNGGINYLVKISNDTNVLYTKEITINTNHIVTMSAKLPEEERSTYLKNYVDKVLNSDTTNTLLYENVYEITNNTSKFNLILDQKDKVKIDQITVTDKIFELKTGDSKRIKYTVYPSNGTIGDIKFKVADEKIAKVDENGVVTGLSKGYTFIECILGYSSQKILVAVDMTIKEVLDSYLYMIDDHVVVTYDVLRNGLNNIENALSSTISSNFYKYTSDWLPFSVDAKVENNKTYAAIQYDSYSYYGSYITSNYKEITYELQGIRLDKYEYELKTGDEVDTKLFFSEGDNNNLYMTYETDGIVELNKDGILKALKPGITSIYIHDKYNKYWNYATIYVDLDKYLNNVESELKQNSLEVNAIDFFYNPDNFQATVNNKLYQKIRLYSLNRNTNLECNDESLSCSLKIYGKHNDISNYNKLYKQIDFNIKKVGIYLDEQELEIDLNESKEIKYNLLNDNSNVKVKSLNTDICTIENNQIKGVGIGFCTVRYKSDKYINYQQIIVGKQNMIDGYKTLVNSLDNTMEVPFLGFDIDNVKADERILPGLDFELAFGSISNKVKTILGYSDKYRVTVGIDYEQEDYSNVKITLIPVYSFHDSKNEYYYNTELYDVGIEKYVTIIPTTIDEDALKLGAKIKEQTKDKYELNLLQYLKFRLSGKSNGLFEYSGFYEMLKKECPTCTYDSFSGGMGVGDNGVIGEGADYIIFKDYNPIAYLQLFFEANVKVLQTGEIFSEEEYIELLKETVRKAYLEAKNSISNVSRIAPVSYSLRKLSDDIDVNIEKSFDMSSKQMVYTITVEDITFKTAINNEVSGELKYTYSVTNIEVEADEIELNKGLSKIIEYTITPDNATNKEVEFKSSDNNIVAVDEKGTIKAINSGSAIITITSKDGNASRQIKVTVIDSDVASIDIKLGDINCDGRLNMTDIVRLRKYFAGLETLNEQSLKNADINKDGKQNMTDLIKLRKHLAGLEEI